MTKLNNPQIKVLHRRFLILLSLVLVLIAWQVYRKYQINHAEEHLRTARTNRAKAFSGSNHELQVGKDIEMGYYDAKVTVGQAHTTGSFLSTGQVYRNLFFAHDNRINDTLYTKATLLTYRPATFKPLIFQNNQCLLTDKFGEFKAKSDLPIGRYRVKLISANPKTALILIGNSTNLKIGQATTLKLKQNDILQLSVIQQALTNVQILIEKLN